MTLFDLRFSWAIAAFFPLSAVALLVVAGPAWRSCQAQRAEHQNLCRWLEYSLSASITTGALSPGTGRIPTAAPDGSRGQGRLMMSAPRSLCVPPPTGRPGGANGSEASS